MKQLVFGGYRMGTIKTELCDKFCWVSSSGVFSSEQMHVFDTIDMVMGLKTKIHFYSNVNGDLQGNAKSLCDSKIFPISSSDLVWEGTIIADLKCMYC